MPQRRRETEPEMNFARTALLLAAMTGLFLAVGYLIGGQGGMIDRASSSRWP